MDSRRQGAGMPRLGQGVASVVRLTIRQTAWRRQYFGLMWVVATTIGTSLAPCQAQNLGSASVSLSADGLTSTSFGTITGTTPGGVSSGGVPYPPSTCTASAAPGGASASGSGELCSAVASVSYFVKITGINNSFAPVSVPVIMSVQGTASGGGGNGGGAQSGATISYYGSLAGLIGGQACVPNCLNLTSPGFDASITVSSYPGAVFEIQMRASAGPFEGESWNATADVTLSIDPSFPGASAYSLMYSPNAPAAVGPFAKVDGGCGDLSGQVMCGNPINIGSGNKFEQIVDYQAAGENTLGFTRYYNGRGNIDNPATFATTLAVDWRSTYDRYLRISSPTVLYAERADGQALTFTLNNGILTAGGDVDLTLAPPGGCAANGSLQTCPLNATWTLTDHDDTVETYTAISAAEAILSSIKTRNGYTQTLNYNGSNLLVSVVDSYRRSLSFTYQNGLLNRLMTPDGLVVTYSYSSSGVTPGMFDRLASVSYSTNPATSQSYLYENTSFPFALTGIIDKNGNRFATWTYDSSGRALRSQHGRRCRSNDNLI